MDWNLIKSFLAIERTGSLLAAARQLGVNHSTVFRRLNAFEKEIGGRVFERVNNRYELTSIGIEMIAHAQRIENSFDTIERKIVGTDSNPKGVVKITAPTNIAYRYLPRYIEKFNQIYPNIHIELLVSNQEFNMTNRQADIAVRATPSPPEHLVGRQVSTINWGAYASRRYEIKLGLPTVVDDLHGHSLIGATGALRNLPVFTWLEKNWSQNITARCDELVAMSYFAEAGQGIAFLPDDQTRSGIVRLFDLGLDHTSDLWLLTHPDLRNVERIKLVMRHLSKAFMGEKF